MTLKSLSIALLATWVFVPSMTSAKTWSEMTDPEKIQYLYNQLSAQKSTLSNLQTAALTKDSSIAYSYSKDGHQNYTPSGQSIESKLKHITFADNRKGYSRAVIVGVDNDYIPPSEYASVGDSIMYGINNFDTGYNNTVLGSDSHAFGRESLAVGYQAEAGGFLGLAIGAFSHAGGGLVYNGSIYATSTAIGFNAATNRLGNSFGVGTVNTQTAGLAIGTLAVVNGDNKYKQTIQSAALSSTFARDIYAAYAKDHGGQDALDKEVVEHYRSFLEGIHYFDHSVKDHEDKIMWDLRESYVLDKLGAEASGGVAIGYSAYSGIANSVALGTGSEALRAVQPVLKGYLTEDKPLNKDQLRGALSVGSEGIYRQIINVADGSEDFDAVNVRQLKAAVAKVEANAGAAQPANPSKEYTFEGKEGIKVDTQTDKTDANKIKVIISGSGMGSGATTIHYSANDGDKKEVDLGDGLNFRSGENTTVKVEDGGKVTYDISSNLKEISTISGNGTTLTLTNKGIDMGGKKITNLAPGTDPGDAVNVSQLKDAVAQTKQYANSLNASSIATASLGQVTLPGHSLVSLGMGHSGTESATAIGISTMSDNAKWIFKANASVNRRNTTFGGSVSYQW